MSIKTVLAVTAALVMFAAPAFASGGWCYYGQDCTLTPDAWGLVEHGEACGEGHAQSPIDIVTSDVQPGSVGLDYALTGDIAEYLNNGHAVTVYPLGRSITVTDANGDTTTYNLLQFHFHTLSEHTVDGEHRAMEMHLVHSDGDKLAVLGVFIEEGEENEVLEQIFAHLPHAAGHGDEVPAALLAKVTNNYEKLLPKERAFWSYSGSLTTPPCSEIVTWVVFKEPITMSAEQIEAYRDLFEEGGVRYDTNRPTMPLNGRPVTSNRGH